MALGQLYLETGNNKVEEAITRIQKHEPPEGYFLANSYGKDSGVVNHLAIRARVNFQAYYCRTGIDPPEAIKFGRQNYPDVIEIPPLMTMWQGIALKGLPLRHRRWCCEVLKEHAGNGRVILQGIRWAESASRRRRWDVWNSWFKYKGSTAGEITKATCSPIIDWSTQDIWEYTKANNLPYCELYDFGFKRLGCVLCPFCRGWQLKMEIERYPKIVKAYRRAAKRYYDKCVVEGKVLKHDSADEYFEWWLAR